MVGRGSMTLPGLLAELVEEHGDAPALVGGGELLTFAKLEERSRRLAGGIAKRGIGVGDGVAVWLPNLFAVVELEFALARLGAVMVALNTRFRAHELADVLSRSGARRGLSLSPVWLHRGCARRGVSVRAQRGRSGGSGASATPYTPFASFA